MDDIARLFLITPLIDDASFASRIAEACSAGDVAVVLARLKGDDERALVNLVKALAPAVQEHGATLMISVEGESDGATIAARGGADGVHATGSPELFRSLRERMKADRAVGAGGIRSKDDAMIIGEAGVDYLMFGEPRADGFIPDLQGVVERATWWAEIFEPPCVAFSPTLDDVPTLAATGAEFVALEAAVWSHPDGVAKAVRTALAHLADSGAKA
jgi:thiamine-phosphate pyrophosphorylase